MVLRRPAWVPITNATIAYRRGAEQATDEVATLIVNRDLASSMRAVPGEVGGLRWEAVNPSGGVARGVEQPRSAADEAAASGEPTPAPVAPVGPPPAAP